MKFSSDLIPATLIRRYKRFLADVTLVGNDKVITVHTPNTGTMLGCAEPGSRVWLQDSGNPARKYPLGWELSTSETGTLIGVNTHLANQLVREGIETGVIAELQGYESLCQEVHWSKVGYDRIVIIHKYCRYSGVGVRYFAIVNSRACPVDEVIMQVRRSSQINNCAMAVIKTAFSRTCY